MYNHSKKCFNTWKAYVQHSDNHFVDSRYNLVHWIVLGFDRLINICYKQQNLVTE